MVLSEALKEWLRRPRFWGVLWVVLSIMLGSGVTVGLQSWMDSAKPHIVKVNWVRLESGARGRWINVQLTAPAAEGCLRTSQHLLFQDAAPGNNWKMRHYVPLGSALNGMAYSAAVSDFNVLLTIPDGLPGGDWWYLDRSAYFCSVWPFIHIVQSQTDPVMVRIDPEILP